MTHHANIPMNRRSFLATSAAGITLAATRGESATLPRVGLIGRGETGTRLRHIAMANHISLQLVAVADADPHRLNGLPGDIQYTTNWESLIDDVHLDAVLIATPDHLHLTMAQAALNAGKHVYLVPPFAHSCAETDALFQAAAEAKGQLYIAKDRPATTHWIEYRNALAEGEPDRPRWIQTDIPVTSTRPQGHWSHQRNGGLGDAACAVYSSLYALMDTFKLGPPRQSTVLGGTFGDEGRETPNALTFSAEFDGGLRVTLTARSADGTPHPTTLRGHNRTIERAPHPAEVEFDLAEWASQPGYNNAEFANGLQVARNAQIALGTALERSVLS